MYDENPCVGTCDICKLKIYACDDIYRLGSDRNAPIVHDECLVPVEGWELHEQQTQEAYEEDCNARYEAWKQDGVLV